MLMAVEGDLEDACASSPTSSTYCYELQCAVRIESIGGAHSGGAVQCKQAVVTLGRNTKRQIILQIQLKNVKGVRFVSYLMQQCKLHGKSIKQGRGAVEICSKQIVVFLSNCPPRRLNVFLKTLNAKMMLMDGSCKGSAPRTPIAVIRREMLEGLPYVFEALSPLTVAEIKQLQRLRKLRADPENNENSASQLGKEGTPRSHLKRRPFTNLRQIPNGSNGTFFERKSAVNEQVPAQLSLEQKAVVHAVVNGKRSVFFTGSAGTGKSLVLQRVIELLPPETTFITAATGVAACQIGGVTLHSFAGIGTGTADKERCVQLASRKLIRTQWERCEHLIIDEISMIDADFFEKIEYVARKIRRNDEPFGGIQLIITGDFFQLPPITKRDKSIRFCFTSSAWKRCIHKIFILREVKRQDDSEFIDILQQIRFGRCSISAINRLNTTRNVDFESLGVVPTRLCTHTADADSVNAQQLDLLEGEEKCFVAEDNQHFPDSLQLSVPARIVLKVGAQVMLTKNLDLSRHLSNGSRGVVKRFSAYGFPVVCFVANDSDDIEIRPVRFTVRMPGCDELVVRRQIPLQLAWAISIHKSQGLTLDAVEMSLSRVFADGQAYVALSRAKSLKSLRLIGFDSSCVRANRTVIEYYEQIERMEDDDCYSNTVNKQQPHLKRKSQFSL